MTLWMDVLGVEFKIKIKHVTLRIWLNLHGSASGLILVEFNLISPLSNLIDLSFCLLFFSNSIQLGYNWIEFNLVVGLNNFKNKSLIDKWQCNNNINK